MGRVSVNPKEKVLEISELTSDEEGIPMWSTREQERYNPLTVESYVQSGIETFYNIVSQTPTTTLDYSNAKSKVVVELLTYIKTQCHGQ